MEFKEFREMVKEESDKYGIEVDDVFMYKYWMCYVVQNKMEKEEYERVSKYKDR